LIFVVVLIQSYCLEPPITLCSIILKLTHSPLFPSIFKNFSKG